MYRLDINFVSNRQDASLSHSANRLPTPQESSISVLMECTDGAVKLFGQLKRFVQINLTGCTGGVVVLFGRINRVIRTYLNKTVGRAEDPEIILEQSIIDMQEDLIQLRQAVARATATQKRIHLQYNRLQSVSSLQINLLRGRRDEQLTANNRQDIQQKKNSIFAKIRSKPEHSPQKALILQKIGAETATVLKTKLDEQTALVDNLKRQLIALEAKISQTKTKKDLHKAQVAAAKANEQLQHTISQLNYGDITFASEVMEEKLAHREAVLEDRKMLMCFSETSWEVAIGVLEKAIAAKLKNQTVQEIREKILQIDIRLRARLQAIVVLICWHEELRNWKFQILALLILKQQEDLENLVKLIMQLRQVHNSELFEQAIEMIVDQKRNLLQYRQVQRGAIRCQERANFALQNGEENWAREGLIRKKSFIQMASLLNTKLDEKTPLVEEIRLTMKEWKNKILDNDQTPLVEKIRLQLKKINPKISEFRLLYSRFIDKL